MEGWEWGVASPGWGLGGLVERQRQLDGLVFQQWTSSASVKSRYRLKDLCTLMRYARQLSHRRCLSGIYYCVGLRSQLGHVLLHLLHHRENICHHCSRIVRHVDYQIVQIGQRHMAEH